MNTTHFHRFLLIAAIAAAVVGCDDESTTPETPPAEATGPVTPATPEAPAPAPPVQELMANHFQRAWAARDAIIAGDFAGARTAMAWLAEPHDDASLPEEVRPRIEPMREAAREFGAATELARAGDAFARMLARCGTCHEQTQRRPNFEPPPPPTGDSVQAHMQRHRWAADRMWEGLVGARPELFQQGAAVLHETELHQEDFAADGVDPERLQALAQYVHDTADQAKEATTEQARVEAYGRFLATCAGCHRLVGRGPGAASEPSVLPPAAP